MRQQGINDGTEPNRTATTIKNKLKGRSKKMAGHLKNFSYAQLSTTAQAVTLTADTEGATLFINGLEVPYADFNGHLFAPVELTAKAPAGYRFAGWKKGSDTYSASETVSLPTDATVSLTATFTPLTDDELKAQAITPVRINEVGADNGIYVNEYFKRNDWVELYNTTDDPVDVEGMYLTDNPEKPTKYQISKESTSANTVIPPHGYLIIWCDKLETKDQLHAPFKLAAEGDELQLTAADESWTDRFVYAEMKADQTAGRYPDGYGDVYTMNVPTIARANIMSSYAVPVEQPVPTGVSDLMADAAITLRYAGGRLIISGTDCSVQLSIVNLAGQAVANTAVQLIAGTADVPVDNLQTAVYVATATDAHGNKTTCKFIKR